MSDAGPILERLDRLERGNRRLRRQVALPWLALGAILLLGQAPARQKIVEAQRFALVDASGNVVGGLAAGDKGPTLTFLDQAGVRLSLSHEAILLYDRNKEVRFMLRVQDEGTASAILFDAKGEGRVQLRVAQDGRAGVLVHPRDGKPEILGGR